jgi:hypothetical protein
LLLLFKRSSEGSENILPSNFLFIFSTKYSYGV